MQLTRRFVINQLLATIPEAFVPLTLNHSHILRSQLPTSSSLLPFSANWSRRFTTSPQKDSRSDSLPEKKTAQGTENPIENEVSTAEVVEELRKAINELETQLISTESKCKELQDKLLRSLAENENARMRYQKEVS